jgi:threonine dehydrogenase-like Zn-dependent dehydrogenase
MRSLVYRINPLGWATCRWLRHIWAGCLVTRLNGLSLEEVGEPELPADDWVRVRPLMAGICGSDVAILAQRYPPDSVLQAYSSWPGGLGHENVSVVEAAGPAVDEAWVGRRVCVEPALSCEVRGIAPPCARCREGLYCLCENLTAGGAGEAPASAAGPPSGAAALPPGTGVGFNARTGGAFADGFLAHVSQLVGVPDALADEQAVLTDPLACALHAVLRVDLADAQRVCVYGTGAVGLGVIAALRAAGYAGRTDALDRAAYLAPLADAAGASYSGAVPASRRERFELAAGRTGGRVHRVRFGNYVLSGGYDAVFVCAGGAEALTESIKWTRPRGQVALVAATDAAGADLTSVWLREVHLVGVFGRQVEAFEGRRVRTYELVHELMAAGRLKTDGLLTHTFRLGEYRKAFRIAMNKGPHRAVKVAFDLRPGEGACDRER